MASSVSIVVPTYNSEGTIGRCLDSIRRQTIPVELIVVDNSSTDLTREIAASVADHVLVAGPERSAQRNVGMANAAGDVIGFIDSDMILEPRVAEEAIQRVNAGDAGVVVPEFTTGSSYWAHVRAFEREMYLGLPGVEAARFFPRSLVQELGGYDERLTGGEDWDLDVRVRARGVIGRTNARIEHDEGAVGLIGACRKKAYYADGYETFTKTHGVGTMLKIAFERPYFRDPTKLVSPYGPGLVVLKLGEAFAMAGHLISGRLRAR
ncbi:MAG: glycosyltransferase family 2 protein [Acidimicrobiales bacterium]